MVTPSQYVAAQNGTVARALRDLRRFWSKLDLSDGVAVRRAMERFWPELLATYGEITATLAADRFEELTGLSPVMVRAVDPERANARMRWGLAPLFGAEGDTMERLTLLVDELVKQPGRSTMVRSTSERKILYARIPTGRDTCDWCLMLASRGAVYGSEMSAGYVVGRGHSTKLGARGRRGLGVKTRGTREIGQKFHGKCDCRVEPIGGPEDEERLLSEGYDPDALYDRWQEQVKAKAAHTH